MLFRWGKENNENLFAYLLFSRITLPLGENKFTNGNAERRKMVVILWDTFLKAMAKLLHFFPQNRFSSVFFHSQYWT